MEELFLDFWNRGASAGWLILAVVILRLVLKKAPKSVHCLLWLLVGVRLICTFSIQSAASLIPSAEVIPQAVLTEPMPQIHTGLSVINGPINNHIAEHYVEGVTIPVGQTRSIVSICAIVWLIGAAFMLLWALASCLRLRRLVAEAVPDEDGVWLCDRIASPFLLGIFRPRIYLPFRLDEDIRTYVAAHEKAHLKRFDHITKPAGFLLLSVYWFQPLVWLAYILLCRDIELACDERVIRELGVECKKPFSEALLRCSIKRGGAAACPLAFGEVGVKERVKNVLNYRKPAFWVVAVSLAVCAVAAVCFLTDPVRNAPVIDEPVSNVANIVSNNSAMLNSMEPSHTYICGATLYQSPVLSSYFPDGSSLGTIVEQGNILSIADETSGESTTCKLTETQTYSPEEFFTQFPNDVFSLLPEDTVSITRRTFQKVHLWEITTANGDTLLWIGDPTVRLYALIDLDNAFPFLVNGALWTYDPFTSTVIPIRFELEGPVAVSADALSRDLRSGEWSEELSVESGETIYWMPSQDSAPEEEAALKYRFQWDSDWVEVDQWRETLTLRPAMRYQGQYGSKTYGISNNWLGAASSAIHRSVLCVDMETGELVISLYGNTPDERGPYAVGWPETSGGITIKGKSIPPEVSDVAAVQ